MNKNIETITAAKIIAFGAIIAAIIGGVALYIVNTSNGVKSGIIEVTSSFLPSIGHTHKTTIVKISIGDFQEIDLWYSRKLRISVLDIRSSSFLSPFQSPREVTGVEIDLDTGGGLVFGGEYTVETGVNKYLLQQFDAQNEEPYSVFAYHVGDDSFHFLRVFVEHINPISKEVTLNIFSFNQ